MLPAPLLSPLPASQHFRLLITPSPTPSPQQRLHFPPHDQLSAFPPDLHLPPPSYQHPLHYPQIRPKGRKKGQEEASKRALLCEGGIGKEKHRDERKLEPKHITFISFIFIFIFLFVVEFLYARDLNSFLESWEEGKGRKEEKEK